VVPLQEPRCLRSNPSRGDVSPFSRCR
jgi:hypothetical protein